LAHGPRHSFPTRRASDLVFLLDMSGSMGKTDYHKADPKKWPAVCATLGKLMASLPDLEKYQVILFADGTRYPLGQEGKWLEYRPDRTSTRLNSSHQIISY